jgi:hypothetical protein
VPAVLATAAVVAIVVSRWRAAEADERRAVRWLGLGLLWSTAFLAVAAPSLASVVPGLPNDHYHAFADPMVVVLVGIGAAAVVREATAAGRAPLGVAAAGLGVALLVGWNLTHLPPAVHPDGGWPAGEAAGDVVIAALEGAGIGADDVVLLRSLPDFKSTEAVAYPLARRGWSFIAETPQGTAPGSLDPLEASSFEEPAGWVLLCDQRFREAIGADCGGPAEDAAAAEGGFGPLLDRVEAQPDRWVSVYAAAT